MPIVTAAAPAIATAVAGLAGVGTYNLFDNAHAYIGVGDTATAFSLADTNLKAAANSANRSFKAMDATYPQVTGSTITYRATFGTGDANFTWAEVILANADLSALAPGDSPAAPNATLSRKVQALGAKTSSQTFQITVNIAIGVTTP